MSHILIPRGTEAELHDAEGDWLEGKDQPKPRWWPDANGDPLIRCGECGGMSGLQHEIAADGTVSPSIWHDVKYKGKQFCNWHVFGKLEGWTGGARPSRRT